MPETPITSTLTPTATNLIAAENLHVSRDKHSILRDVSLQIGDGDFVTIVGPNGAGKSMLIKCLLGFYKPDRGKVILREGLRIGYVPQNLTPDFTIPVSVRRFLSLRRNHDSTNAEHIAAETQITDILDKQLHSLSGGQLQRVLLARALINNPSLLVLDEPAQHLDVGGQLLFYQLLERIYRERNIGILMVSHDLHFVMRSTKRVICLFHHVCCFGEPHEVAQTPEFLALFGDEMTRLMTVYRHIHNHPPHTDAE